MPGVLWFQEQDHFQCRYESKGQVTQAPAEITIARELLGWEPTMDLRSGIRETLPYFRDALERNDAEARTI